jgi:hypothetical protein
MGVLVLSYNLLLSDLNLLNFIKYLSHIMLLEGIIICKLMRVVQNHLIETGSARTGSMIIWDTGEYSILPYYPDPKVPETDDSRSDISEASMPSPERLSESEKLREAFQTVCHSIEMIWRYPSFWRCKLRRRTSVKFDYDCMEPGYHRIIQSPSVSPRRTISRHERERLSASDVDVQRHLQPAHRRVLRLLLGRDKLLKEYPARLLRKACQMGIMTPPTLRLPLHQTKKTKTRKPA